MTRIFQPDHQAGLKLDSSGLQLVASESLLEETRQQKSTGTGAGSELGHALKDFVQSTIYTGIAEPVLGVAQICDKAAGTHAMAAAKGTLAEFGISAPEKTTGLLGRHAQMLGNAVGMMLPYLLLHRAVRGAATNAFGEEALAAKGDLGLLSRQQFGAMTAKEAGLSFATGFAYDGALRPSNDDNNGAGFVQDRILNGVSGGATMAALTASMLGLGRLGGSAAISSDWDESALTNPMSAGVISAVPAGLVASEANALRQGKLQPTAAEAGQNIYQMGFVGLALGAAHLAGLDKPAEHEGKQAEHTIERLSDSAPATIPNPYLDAVNSMEWLQQIRERMGNDKMRHAESGNIDAQHAIRERYAYAVPTQGAIDAIHEYSAGKVVEIGAGRGYWASMLRQRGTDVAAYDTMPPGTRGNMFIGLQNHSYTKVEKGGIEMIQNHPDHTLLMVWPPPNDPMAIDALRQYKGRYLMYVGEGDDVTGTLSFQYMLLSRWRPVKSVELPHFPRNDDDLTIYERKPKSKWDKDFEEMIKTSEADEQRQRDQI